MVVDKINQDLNQSLKSGDKNRTETLRYLLAAIKRYVIDTYPPEKQNVYSDTDVEKIIKKQVKEHRESIEAFAKGKRKDLVERESAQLAVLEEYLPKELTDSEIEAIVMSVKASGANQFGAMMGAVMKQVAGRASGDRVQQILKRSLEA